jgi:precorrin-6A/cobalt-precorrin-6A reductase
MVVSKNAGGRGAYAKIEAARQLSLPVIMIERPILSLPRDEAFLVTEAMDWIAGH